MKIKMSSLRAIIREELRRSIIIEARNIIASSVGQNLLREWNEKQRQRHTGIGPYASIENRPPEQDPAELVQFALRLLDDAGKNENVDIQSVIRQLEKVFGNLQNQTNTTKSKTWAFGVGQAIRLLKGMTDPAQRKVRVNKAKDAVVNLGRSVEID